MEKLKKIIKYVDKVSVRKDYEKRNRLRKKLGGTKIMGMSASQMRYCLIAGKQNDVEFQGQQINQQRTTLATQSSAANTQLLNMVVPTPPSSSDYTKTSYTFDKNGETCDITGTQYQSAPYTLNGNAYAAGTYIVNYTTDTTADIGKTAGTKKISYDGTSYTTGTTASGGNTLKAVDLSNYLTDKDQMTDVNNLLTICQDCHLTVGTPPVAVTTTAQLAALPANTFYKYESIENTTTGSQTSAGTVTKYVLAKDLPATAAASPKDVSLYYVDESAKKTESEQLGGAEVTWSETGRMSSITTADAAGNKTTYSLNVQTKKDDDAYGDAYNEYEYQKNQYDNEIQAVNAKISVIQSQDKKLELKLQDLDTQQKALSTESESVKKVIDKNIETSFKTFA